MYVPKISPGDVRDWGGGVRGRGKFGPYIGSKINSKSIQNWSPIRDRNQSQIGPLYGIVLKAPLRTKNVDFASEVFTFSGVAAGGGATPQNHPQYHPAGPPRRTTPRDPPLYHPAGPPRRTTPRDHPPGGPWGKLKGGFENDKTYVKKKKTIDPYDFDKKKKTIHPYDFNRKIRNKKNQLTNKKSINPFEFEGEIREEKNRKKKTKHKSPLTNMLTHSNSKEKFKKPKQKIGNKGIEIHRCLRRL